MADKMATRQAYGKALVELGEKHPELVVMDADLSKSTMTAEFGKVYPERFFNMGIAEANMMCVAAGLAATGKIPFAKDSTYYHLRRKHSDDELEEKYEEMSIKRATVYFIIAVLSFIFWIVCELLAAI